MFFDKEKHRDRLYNDGLLDHIDDLLLKWFCGIVDSLLRPHQAMTEIEATAQAVCDKANEIDKPILTCFMGEKRIKAGIDILAKNNNEAFYVDKLSNAGNPKHGQVWGYENKLLRYTIS